MDNKCVLIVGGESELRRQLSEFFASQRTEVWDVEGVAQGRSLLRRHPVDIVVATGNALRNNGNHVVAEVRKLDDKVEVVVIVDEPEHGRGALAEGAYDFFLEPVDFQRLGVVVRHIAETAELRERSEILGQLVEGTARLGKLVTRDLGVIQLFTTIRRLGRGDRPVLIEGETGAGKESVARVLHELGGSERTFVAVEGATLSSEDLEQAYAQARGGTLFVDDVLALRPEVAATLVALLDQGGAGANGTSAARVIATAREDVGRRARQGTLREDLYTRFADAVLKLPPLRERRGDIPVIAQELLRDLAGRGQEPRRLSREAEEALLAHDWRGNVDEVQEVIEQTAASASGPRIEVADLPPQFHNQRPTETQQGEGESRMLRDIEVQHLRKVLFETRGNKARAARILGLSRWALQRKLQKHGIRIDELLAQPGAAS